MIIEEIKNDLLVLYVVQRMFGSWFRWIHDDLFQNPIANQLEGGRFEAAFR